MGKELAWSAVGIAFLLYAFHWLFVTQAPAWTAAHAWLEHH